MQTLQQTQPAHITLEDHKTWRESEIGPLLIRVGRAFSTYVRRSLLDAGHELSHEQWQVLTHLWQQNAQSQQALAIALNKDKTSMTRLLDTLEKNNYVTRVSDKTDRRQKLIHLTEAGVALREPLIQLVKKVENTVLEGLPDTEVEVTRKVLKELLVRMRGYVDVAQEG